jgi:hypothetical protein
VNRRSDEDSLRYLTGLVLDQFHEYMQQSENADLYALTFLGANMEALHILSEMTLMANNREKMLAIVNDCDEQIKSLSTLIGLLSVNESAKLYLEKMTPVLQFFKETDTITEENLPVVAGLIETARSSMIQM